MSNSEEIQTVYDEDGNLVAESAHKGIITITTRLATSADAVEDDMLVFKPLCLSEKSVPPKHPEFVDIPDIGGYEAGGIIMFPLKYSIEFNDDLSDAVLTTYNWDEEGLGLGTETIEAVNAHADEYWTDEIYASYREHLASLRQDRYDFLQQARQQAEDQQSDPE
jgi:hypothetical protein